MIVFFTFMGNRLAMFLTICEGCGNLEPRIGYVDLKNMVVTSHRPE